MIYAIHNDERVCASPGGRAACPTCGGVVIGKCGEIVCWHWAHEAITDCDLWAEGESAWHMHWKRRFPDSWQEVVVGVHRADIRTDSGCVIELQRSPLDVRAIAERERYYGNMVWVIDAEDFRENLSLRNRNGYTTFRWRWPRKSWWVARKPMYWDMHRDGWLFEVRKLYAHCPCGGWGRWVNETALFCR